MKKNVLTSMITIFIILLSFSLCNAGGNDITLSPDFVTQVGQKGFEDLSKEVGLIISYIPLAPAEPLGITGLDIGLEVTGVKISSGASFWSKAIANQEAPDYVVLPKLHVQKGLPFNIDIGVIYATVPGSNISLFGGELKWAVLRGSALSPAVALRGTYTALAGVADIDASTYGLDASVSKGFGPLTPYAGLGETWIKTSENVDAIPLNDVSTSATKFFVGTKIKLLLLSVVLQADFSDVQMYSARANMSF